MGSLTALSLIQLVNPRKLALKAPPNNYSVLHHLSNLAPKSNCTRPTSLHLKLGKALTMSASYLGFNNDLSTGQKSQPNNVNFK